MAIGDYQPGDMLKKVLSEPDMAKKMREVDEYAGTNISGLYDNIDKTRKQLDYLDIQRQSAQNLAPQEIIPISTGVKSDLASGDALTGPRKHSAYDNSENINNLINQLDDVSQLSQDPYKWAKPYSFNTGVYNADFDRYYTHPLYSKLGYSPFRNNDEVYNKKASWLDDNRRMWGQWLGLTWEGIKPMWGGSSDGEEFNRRLQISQSSKGGVGAFTTNLLGNFSYTAGVAASFLVQEAALALATAATGGIASEVTIPGMALVGVRAAKIFGLAKDFAATRKILESANNARNVYNSVKGAKTAFNVAERFGLPLQGAKSVYAIGKGLKGYENLTTLAKISTTGGGFLRDLVALNGAYAESKLEGEGEQIKMTDDLIGAYYKKNGRMPVGKDANKIYDLAREAGFKTKLYNMPLLMVTNNVVFGKAFRGFTPRWLAEAQLTGKIPMETIKNVNWKKAGVAAYEVAPEGFRKFMIKNYWKQRPTKIIVGALNYGKANFFEGGQEVMQEVIASSIDEYYKGVYTDPTLAGAKQYWASFKNGTAAQVSGQGLETFLSGFLMGGILQVPQNLFMGYVPRLTMGKTKYEDYKARRETQTNAVVDALNDVVMNTGKYASLVEENLVHQKNLAKSMQASEAANDRKGYQDAKNASMFTHIRTLIEHGQYDVFENAMKSMRDWTDEELGEAFNTKIEGDIDNKDVRQRLEDGITEVEHIKNRYDNLTERFNNPFNPDLYNKETQHDQWQEEVDRRSAFEDVKFHVVYANYAFEKALNRMSSILNDLSSSKKPFANFSTSDVVSLFDPVQTQNQRKAMVDEIKIYQDGDATQKKIAAQVSKKLKAFDDLAEQIDAYRKIIDESRQEPTQPLTPEQELKKTEALETVNKKLAKTYLKYMKVLASANNEQILDAQVYPSLNGIKDYMELDKDSRSMAGFINHLHDPDNFTTIVNRRYESIRETMKNRENLIREAISKFHDMGDQNDGIFGRIGDAGAWMYQDSVDAFMKGEDDKLIFQHLDAPYGQVESGSEKHTKIMQIIAEYRAMTKPSVSEEAKVDIPEGFRVVAEGETLPAGDYTHYMNYKGSGINITSAPIKTEEKPTKAEPVKKAPISPITEGEIIYTTPTIDIEVLVTKMPDKYESGDAILMSYLTTLAEEFREIKIPETANKAGQVFSNFLRGRPDTKKFINEIKSIFRKRANEGKTILTSNWFVLDKDDKIPLATRMISSTDKAGIMEALRAQGTTDVENRLKTILQREDAFKIKFPAKVQELPKGIIIEDILEKKKLSKEQGRQAMIDKINASPTLDTLNKLEEDINESLTRDPEYLIRYGLDSKDITDLMNKKREDLVKHPVFGSLKVGSTLIMKDGSRLYIETKTRAGVPLVKKPGREALTKMIDTDLKNIKQIIPQGTPVPTTEAPVITSEDKEASSTTLKDQKNISNDSGALTQIRKEADGKSKKDIDDDFMNTIGCE